MSMRAVAGLLWVLALVQVVTVQPAETFSFPEPLSWEHAGLVAAFLVTSLGLLVRWRTGPAVHAAVVAAVIVLHPLTVFGRDGSTVVLMLWLGVVLARLSLRREWLLVFASTAAALLAVEALLAALRPPVTPVDLPDYGDVMGPDGPCGFLRPNLAMDVVGEDGRARFVTNSLGLRLDHDVTSDRSSEAYRILLLGDSFVAGYRTGQRETVGARLGQILSERSGRQVEVLPGGTGHPGASLEVATTCANLVHPDRLVVGITLGNDLSQSWFAERELPADAIEGLFLPADASKSWPRLLSIKVRRSVRAWRLFRLSEALMGTEVISSWFRDAPTAVHLFDPGHSLGHFYVRRELEPVRESYDATVHYLTAIANAARSLGTPVTFALFPQRFQVWDREWDATLFEYGLDPAAFDPDAPNRRLMAACLAGGLTCVDLLPAFRDATASGVHPLYQRRGDMHWNRQGHDTAARALAAALDPR